jgi:hypothetical protein
VKYNRRVQLTNLSKRTVEDGSLKHWIRKVEVTLTGEFDTLVGKKKEPKPQPNICSIITTYIK